MNWSTYYPDIILFQYPTFETNFVMKNHVLKYLSVLLFGFGVLTFYLSFSLLFDLFNVRNNQEDFVPFVVWTNLIASVLYMISAYGWFTLKPWAIIVIVVALALLILCFIAYMYFITTGGVHLEKTTGALIFRILVTTIFLIGGYFYVSKGQAR